MVTDKPEVEYLGGFFGAIFWAQSYKLNVNFDMYALFTTIYIKYRQYFTHISFQKGHLMMTSCNRKRVSSLRQLDHSQFNRPPLFSAASRADGRRTDAQN